MEGDKLFHVGPARVQFQLEARSIMVFQSACKPTDH